MSSLPLIRSRLGVLGAIGNTPLIYLQHLSQLTGCDIFGKAEFMNPGGSVKDRAALYLVKGAEREKILSRGGTIVEGTAGNTGIGLAMVAGAKGYKTVIFIPETQSPEKMQTLRALGAELKTTPQVPYSNPLNYQNQAKAFAATLENAFWANQFDNVANRQAHYETTGPEIWQQTGGRIDGFVASVGTGGTLAGTSQFLKEKKPSIRTACADPYGAAVWSWIKRGDLAVSDGDSIAEGIGQMRVTKNLEGAPIDEAYRIPDPIAVEILYHLLRQEGLFLSLSSGINVAGAYLLARDLGPGHTIVTILCDGGTRYLSKLYNPDWLATQNLTPIHHDLNFLESFYQDLRNSRSS